MWVICDIAGFRLNFEWTRKHFSVQLIIDKCNNKFILEFLYYIISDVFYFKFQ